MMQRVVILGCGGAGKSTLARALGERTGLPVVHLDREFWKPGWAESSKEEFAARHAECMSGDRWIIDGNYSRTIEPRVAAADTILLLDLPRMTCVHGILSRWIKGRGTTRADMREGCPEKMDLEFFLWVWNYRKRSRAKTLALVESLRTSKTVHVFHSRNDVQRWLGEIRETTA